MSDSGEEALESARRIYDRQVETLDNIDDKAMRAVRTAVLILGFVAAALTTAGPSAVSPAKPLPVGIAALGGFFDECSVRRCRNIYCIQVPCRGPD